MSGLHSFLRAFRRSPLGVWVRWVGEGLKEEIAGERGPWRASRAAQPNIFLSSFLIVPPAELSFTHTKRVAARSAFFPSGKFVHVSGPRFSPSRYRPLPAFRTAPLLQPRFSLSADLMTVADYLTCRAAAELHYSSFIDRRPQHQRQRCDTQGLHGRPAHLARRLPRQVGLGHPPAGTLPPHLSRQPPRFDGFESYSHRNAVQ